MQLLPLLYFSCTYNCLYCYNSSQCAAVSTVAAVCEAVTPVEVLLYVQLFLLLFVIEDTETRLMLYCGSWTHADISNTLVQLTQSTSCGEMSCRYTRLPQGGAPCICMVHAGAAVQQTSDQVGVPPPHVVPGEVGVRGTVGLIPDLRNSLWGEEEQQERLNHPHRQTQVVLISI